MIFGLIIRAARAGYTGGGRPVPRKPRTHTPGGARMALACCLLVVIFVTVVMLTCPMSP